MRLASVRVENFKRFQQLEVEFKPLDCLVGANNSGKTTLLQALALFDFCVHHCLERKNGTIELRRRTISPDEFYVLPIADPMDLWTDRKPMAGGRQRIIRVHVVFDTGLSVTANVKLDFNRFGISIDAADQSAEALTALRDVRISYLPVFSTFLSQEERRTPAVIENELARGRVNGVVRNLILDLKHQDRDGQLVEILQRSFPTLANMSIGFDEITDRYIAVTYLEAGRPKEFDVFASGSGFQQFLYLFGFILLRQPTVILLDEPDVHLHGTLQNVLLQELRNLATEGRQVLFATHSRDLINRVGPENIVWLDEQGARRLRVQFDVYDTLDRLGAIEPTQLPLVQAYRRVLVVEDQTDRALLSVYCTKCLGSPVWQQVERRVAFCYSRGNPWKQDMPRLRQQLQQMLGVTGQPLQLFIVADRDYHPDVDALIESLPNHNLHWHVWRRVEIENYLLCETAICRLVRSRPDDRQMTLDEGLLREEFDRLVENSRDHANDQLVKAFQEFGRSSGSNWDAATLSRKAREYLGQHWETGRVALADAKEDVLPGVKRWLQGRGYGQFSDRALAEAILPEELPQEVHDLARRIAEFAGIAIE